MSHNNNTSQYLHPGRPFESPGSSIFDLPTGRPDFSNVTRTSVLPPPPIQTLGDRDTGAVAHTKRGSGPSYIIISGGTGGNAICSSFVDACFVLPVSDDGGSSSEIIRVLGGPSVGDIRSRLIRLIPQGSRSSPLEAIRNLLAYRLPAKCSDKEAREEWRDIVEGRSTLWMGIPNDRKETIRGFLVSFESELLKRSHKNFDFRNGSIGNYFIAAAQNFFRSLPSAIFLFASITNSQAHILPAIVTNHTVTLAAELENGERLVGQCEISHPVSDSGIVVPKRHTFELDEDEVTISSNNMMYQPIGGEPIPLLPARISKVYYINSYGMEIHPAPNPEFISNLQTLCLAFRYEELQGRLQALIPSAPKSCFNDRETRGYSALDYIKAIVRTLNTDFSTKQYGLGNANTTYPASAFITDLVYLPGTEVEVDQAAITTLGIKCTQMKLPIGGGLPRFEGEEVRHILDKIWKDRQEEAHWGH